MNTHWVKLYYIIVDRGSRFLYNLDNIDYRVPRGREASDVGTPHSDILDDPAKRCGEFLGERGWEFPTGLLALHGDNRCLGLCDSRLLRHF
jgi:hypothetical protein